MERDGRDRGLDAEGYIRREVSAAKIAPPYTEVVDTLRALYRERDSGRLHGLYLNGSVVKGTAVPGVSDLDVLAVTREAPTEEDAETARGISAILERRYPFLSGAGILLAARDDVLSERERYDMGFFVACLCACVDGEDLGPLLPRYKPSLDLARGTNGTVGLMIARARVRLTGADGEERMTTICRGIMRKIVRSAFTLVMPRYGGWTSDLGPCARIFAAYYPAREGDVMWARNLARVPSADRARIVSVLDDFGGWLVREYERVVMAPSGDWRE